MAISKRLRYEILKRDGFACRYCHRDKVIITVDHVIPQALGGSDHPSNLVASCDDCNAGKASALPGGTTVRDVPPFMLQWARAMRGPDAFLVEAAILLWCRRYEGTHDAAPDDDLVDDARQEIASAYSVLSGHVAEFFDGAQHAGGTGEFDIFRAAEEIHDIESTEDAARAWSDAWLTAVGDLPDEESLNTVRRALTRLVAAGADATAVTVAAVYAGSHATRALHFGLTDKQAKSIGIYAPAQRVIDLWSLAWRQACGRWPGVRERKAVRQSLWAVGIDGVHWEADVSAAALAAGAHQSTDLFPGLPLKLSAVGAAERLNAGVR